MSSAISVKCYTRKRKDNTKYVNCQETSTKKKQPTKQPKSSGKLKKIERMLVPNLHKRLYGDIPTLEGAKRQFETNYGKLPPRKELPQVVITTNKRKRRKPDRLSF